MRRRNAFLTGGYFYSSVLTGLPLLGRHGLLDFVRVAEVERDGRLVKRHVSRLTPEERARFR